MFDLIKTVATTPHKSSPSALNIPTLAVIPGQFPNGPRGRIHSGGRFWSLNPMIRSPCVLYSDCALSLRVTGSDPSSLSASCLQPS